MTRILCWGLLTLVFECNEPRCLYISTQMYISFASMSQQNLLTGNIKSTGQFEFFTMSDIHLLPWWSRKAVEPDAWVQTTGGWVQIQYLCSWQREILHLRQCEITPATLTTTNYQGSLASTQCFGIKHYFCKSTELLKRCNRLAASQGQTSRLSEHHTGNGVCGVGSLPALELVPEDSTKDQAIYPPKGLSDLSSHWCEQSHHSRSDLFCLPLTKLWI